MTSPSDPELFSFSQEILVRHGGLIEPREDRLLALLPPELARNLGLPEEVEIGSEQAPLLYGSHVLDRFVGLATREVPVVYGQIRVPYLKKAGFEQLLGTDLAFPGGQARVGSRAEARTTYMVMVCHYVALSDERKEGLVEVGVHEPTGAVVPELVEGWSAFHPEYFEPGKTPPHFPVHLEKAVKSGMRSARRTVESDLADFISSMQRRLRRDTRNTREYYEALQTEMEAGLNHPNLTESQRSDRLSKIGDLPGELERKIADLEQKYQVRVTVSACAALRLLVDVAQLLLVLRYRRLERSLAVTWNPITKRLDPLVCERCGESATRLTPSGEASIRFLCPVCASSPSRR
jgi:hypothetical protein